MYRAFVSCLFRVSCVRFVYRAFVSCIVHSFRVSCICFMYRAFVSYIVRFSCHSCEAFVRFSFFSFAFFVRLRFVRSVSLYDPGSVCTVYQNVLFYKYCCYIFQGNDFDSSQGLLGGSVNRLSNMVSANRGNRKLMCYLIIGLILMFFLTYYLITKVTG